MTLVSVLGDKCGVRGMNKQTHRLLPASEAAMWTLEWAGWPAGPVEACLLLGRGARPGEVPALSSSQTLPILGVCR